MEKPFFPRAGRHQNILLVRSTPAMLQPLSSACPAPRGEDRHWDEVMASTSQSRHWKASSPAAALHRSRCSTLLRARCGCSSCCHGSPQLRAFTSEAPSVSQHHSNTPQKLQIQRVFELALKESACHHLYSSLSSRFCSLPTFAALNQVL